MGELAVLLALGYGLVLGFPLYLYIAVVRWAHDAQYWCKAVLALGPLLFIAFLLVPWASDDPSALLVLSSLVMFSFAKTLETIWNTHDPSVRKSFHRFCLYFAIPSDVSFEGGDDAAKKRGPSVMRQALYRLAYAAFECVLLGLLIATLLLAEAYFPSIFDVGEMWPACGYWNGSCYLHSGLVYTLESYVSFLCIRIVLNGVLLAGAQLAHGEGIIVKDCWGDLTFATSLRQIWAGWNMVVHIAWYRVVYKPLLHSAIIKSLFPNAFRSRQVAAMLATFVFSGFIHEYLIWCRTGGSTGSQVLFFTVQALLLLMEPGALQRPARGTAESSAKKAFRHVAGPVEWSLCLVLTLPVFFHDVGVPMSEFLHGAA